MTTRVSVEYQLEMMENLACASGHTDYESVRSEMLEMLKAEHGSDFELENIDSTRKNEFLEWLSEE